MTGFDKVVGATGPRLARFLVSMPAAWVGAGGHNPVWRAADVRERSGVPRAILPARGARAGAFPAVDKRAAPA